MIPKCGQVNTKMESKIDVNLKWRFLKNRALAAAGARFFIICASKLRRKIDRKSITKPSTRWNAPWHRLSFDFGRFRSASSGGKTIQNRCRKTSKIVMLLARGRLRPGSKGVFPLPSSGNTQSDPKPGKTMLGVPSQGGVRCTAPARSQKSTKCCPRAPKSRVHPPKGPGQRNRNK